jgi:short-subunit dehydrogenase
MLNNKFAVVTGASSGIGFELARKFSENGFDLLIVAEDAGIADAADKLRARADIDYLQLDLRIPGNVDKLYTAITEKNRPLDAIAINAGVGVGGRFIETDLEEEINMISLNVNSSVHLTKKIAKMMVGQGEGKILITSSIAAIMPTPFQAVYGATKAFLLSFAEALRSELKDTGVTVTALMPGATDTNFFRRANLENTKIGEAKKDDPADVARDGFEALMEGKDHVVAHSAKTRMQSIMADILPETAKAEMHRKMAEPGSARH